VFDRFLRRHDSDAELIPDGASSSPISGTSILVLVPRRNSAMGLDPCWAAWFRSWATRPASPICAPFAACIGTAQGIAQKLFSGDPVVKNGGRRVRARGRAWRWRSSRRCWRALPIISSFGAHAAAIDKGRREAITVAQEAAAPACGIAAPPCTLARRALRRGKRSDGPWLDGLAASSIAPIALIKLTGRPALPAGCWRKRGTRRRLSSRAREELGLSEDERKLNQSIAVHNLGCLA